MHLKGIARICAMVVAGLTMASLARGQTVVQSDGVSVRNSAPANVFFAFPAGQSNVVDIQFACAGSGVNPNYVFIYEEQPNGYIATYPFHIDDIACSFSYNQTGTTFSAVLSNPITVVTPDHTLTIDTAVWTAVRASTRSGYYWKASGGSATITLQ